MALNAYTQRKAVAAAMAVARADKRRIRSETMRDGGGAAVPLKAVLHFTGAAGTVVGDVGDFCPENRGGGADGGGRSPGSSRVVSGERRLMWNHWPDATAEGGVVGGVSVGENGADDGPYFVQVAYEGGESVGGALGAVDLEFDQRKPIIPVVGACRGVGAQNLGDGADGASHDRVSLAVAGGGQRRFPPKARGNALPEAGMFEPEANGAVGVEVGLCGEEADAVRELAEPYPNGVPAASGDGQAGLPIRSAQT
ncbi:hypothetical protein BDK51DRAFT_37236 [Blyttiomyces helicus]|uniref:Uncharacterized protein n=1 Tax=Blyttiomyces helicus TaxID=388810 RepID=A0A4P9WQE3_9FUNG|nr:hypothetical protein BDK51DRAFT_37236 [Blyttiomyces helicus]|eukprot:RKO94028.1 hypothetical protein BDK51DRAFT_37236 [Blyttiomyces helicus]